MADLLILGQAMAAVVVIEQTMAAVIDVGQVMSAVVAMVVAAMSIEGEEEHRWLFIRV